MSEMIEKMAIAAWQSLHGPWEFVSDQGKESIRIEMRAALEALREPTDEMIEAGKKARMSWLNHVRIYQHMISAALAEGE